MKYFFLNFCKLLSKIRELFFVCFLTTIKFLFNQFIAKLNSFLLCIFEFNLLSLFYTFDLSFKLIDQTLLDFQSFIVYFYNRGPLLLLAKEGVGCIDVIFGGSWYGFSCIWWRNGWLSYLLWGDEVLYFNYWEIVDHYLRHIFWRLRLDCSNWHVLEALKLA